MSEMALRWELGSRTQAGHTPSKGPPEDGAGRKSGELQWGQVLGPEGLRPGRWVPVTSDWSLRALEGQWRETQQEQTDLMGRVFPRSPWLLSEDGAGQIKKEGWWWSQNGRSHLGQPRHRMKGQERPGVCKKMRSGVSTHTGTGLSRLSPQFGPFWRTIGFQALLGPECKGRKHLLGVTPWFGLIPSYT